MYRPFGNGSVLSSSELIWVMVDKKKNLNYMWCDCKFENICIIDMYKLC